MKAHEFKLKDCHGHVHSLSKYKGKWIVLYFYPKDDTPGCTIEACDFTEYFEEFKGLDAVVLGVSKDSCESHQKFVEKYNLKIFLLSDPEHKVIEEYGVWKPKSFMGKSFLGVERSTFLIDPKGNIAHEWRKVKAKGHAEEVLNKLRDLE